MTAIDTNILIAFDTPGHAASQSATSSLAQAAAIGPLCICGPVFSELLGLPGRTGDDARRLAEDLEIQILWRLEEIDWETAGIAYQGYVRRRSKSGGGLPRRIATDFLIGAHAFVRGYQLLTLDKGLYRAAFPRLKIVSA